MNVRLLYFAVLRDFAGRSEEVLDLPPGSRASDVWNMLRERHRELAGYRQPPMAAVNESYAGSDVELRDGDDLAFIPPVAGG